MSSAVELFLQQQLRAKVPTEIILIDWLSELNLSQPKPEECLSFFEFAYNTGHWKKLIEALPVFLEKRWPLHWGILIQIINDAGLDADEDVVQSVLKGARKQNLVNLLVQSRAWDVKVPELLKFRQRVEEKIAQEAARQKETLREKLGFLRTQRMVEEEGKLLNILRRMYPADQHITQELEEFQDRWARHLLATRSEQKTLNWDNDTPAPPTKEEKQWLTVLIQEMKLQATSKPEAAYWFSTTLYQMGFYNESLEILNLAPASPSRDWLSVEILLKARRFIEVLGLIQELETRYSDDPETTFAVHYSKALALKGLGQTHQAIELLKSLTNIRPNYRSAHSLLLTWTEGDR